jgi:nicotinate-nucleotide adenylyltransferase
MVMLAIAPVPAFELSHIELERTGPSYAVDTVAELAARASAEGRPEPWFVLSAEVLDGFHAWRQPERILELCRLAVAPRLGSEPVDQDWVARHYPGREDRFTFLPGPELDIASTTIRERVRQGLPVSALVPAAVERYILEHGLYRDSGVPT